MLCSYVNTVANPAKSLESHSCTFHIPNPLRITFLRKNRGRGVRTSPLRPRTGLQFGSRLNHTKFFDGLHLGDWIHDPYPRMQESPVPPPTAIPPERLGECYPERNEGSAFLSGSIIPTLLPSQSPVDTTRVLPYSAPANDFASPSPPSSSRHSAALDDVCIAIRYHTVLITRWRNGPAGLLFLCAQFFAPNARNEEKAARDE